MQVKSKTEDNPTAGNDTDRTVPPDVTLQEDTDYSLVAARNSSAPDPPTNETNHCQQIICPPPWLPSNVIFSSDCVCPQIATYMQNNRPMCNFNREGNIFSTKNTTVTYRLTVYIRSLFWVPPARKVRPQRCGITVQIWYGSNM